MKLPDGFLLVAFCIVFLYFWISDEQGWTFMDFISNLVVLYASWDISRWFWWQAFKSWKNRAQLTRKYIKLLHFLSRKICDSLKYRTHLVCFNFLFYCRRAAAGIRGAKFLPHVDATIPKNPSNPQYYNLLLHGNAMKPPPSGLVQVVIVGTPVICHR